MPELETNREQNAADCSLVTELTNEAAAIALSWFKQDPEVWWKEGKSPVSEADYAVDTFLKEKLRAARPDYGWLSEETLDNSDRLNARRTFVVDPIDGTRGFINGMDKWCVSVAIVEDNRPVVAVLAAPVLGETIVARVGQGVALNDTPIAVRTPGDPMVMTGSRAFLSEASEGLEERVVKTPFIPSLAWRIAEVAAGRLDVALARGSARDWDLAAADLIVHEAGGKLTDLHGKILTYNCKSTRQGTLVAAASERFSQVLDIAKIAMNKRID